MVACTAKVVRKEILAGVSTAETLAGVSTAKVVRKETLAGVSTAFYYPSETACNSTRA